MDIKNAVSVYFSPTDSTHRILSAITKELPWPVQELDITDYPADDGEYRLSADELLLAGVPVYGGRVPAAVAQRLKNLHGDETPAVIVAVYGNRDYDDALLELRDLLEQRGFRVIAAAAFIAEHNIMHSVAAGRPDEQDFKALEKFAQEVVKKLARINRDAAAEPLALKGNLPYREI